MKYLYTLSIFLVLSTQQTIAQTYTFSWATGILFNLVGGLLTGNITNVNSSTVNTTVTLGSNQSNAFTTFSGGFTSPTVSGSPFTTDLLTTDLPNLAVGANFIDKTRYSDVTILFSSTVRRVRFNIADIDRSSTNTWDQVTITGYNGAIAVSNPTISKVWAWGNNSIAIAGNTVTASGAGSGSNWLDQDGSVEVDFGTTMLTSIVVRLQAAAASATDPGNQDIGIGNITFQRAIVLPLKLNSFNGALNNNSVNLSWESAQEANLDKYIVEKSIDGVNWETLTTIAANGNSSNATTYSTIDANAAQINYYRLKQIETNGSFTYSQIITIRKGEFEKLSLKLYPNPVISNATISINSESKLAAHIKIYNQFGIQLQHIQRSLIAGSNNIPVQGLQSLPAGTYIIVVEDDKLNQIGTTRFVKQ